MNIRKAQASDATAIASIILPTIREGATYTLDPDLSEHSMEQARSMGYRAMQFNFVVSTNERAVRPWQSLGFEIVGRLPLAFRHPTAGYVDGLVMYRSL